MHKVCAPCSQLTTHTHNTLLCAMVMPTMAWLTFKRGCFLVGRFSFDFNIFVCVYRTSLLQLQKRSSVLVNCLTIKSCLIRTSIISKSLQETAILVNIQQQSSRFSVLGKGALLWRNIEFALSVKSSLTETQVLR